MEATGRGGADDGFDARGFEIVANADSVSSRDDEDDSEAHVADRIWLIQCKREKTITPRKLHAHLEAIPVESRQQLYGMLFVAACDFSKAARDAYRFWCAHNDLAECHIWGKAELEDLLYQPKNDNLLFAYFGLSLKIRRQSISTNLRRITTVKRKLRRVLTDRTRAQFVLVRDVSDLRYPVMDTATLEEGNHLWRIYQMPEIGVRGLRIIVRKHKAYIDPNTGFWDLASGINEGVPTDYANIWQADEVSPLEREKRHAEFEIWNLIPLQNQFYLTFYNEVPYDEILEVDDIGDNVSDLATIFVNFRNGLPPFSEKQQIIAAHAFSPSEKVEIAREDHRRLFPDTVRDLAWEDDWAARNQFDLRAKTLDIVLEPPEWLKELQGQESGHNQETDDTGNAVEI
ncbi:hypothetical protein [Methylobacterium bullatum]|uniref:hypothetical protein n=1 Tax=Methylobacterium bullatum TaxID=570505 RepID=UPI0030CA7950